MDSSKSHPCYRIGAHTLFNIQQEQDGQGDNEPNCQKIIILESGGDTTDEGGKEKKIEFVMRSGIRISVNLTSSHSKADRIIVTIDDDAFHPRENSIEMEVQPDTVSLTTQRDLRIKAKNIEIEADETIRLKSGSTMTINGSLIKIN